MFYCLQITNTIISPQDFTHPRLTNRHLMASVSKIYLDAASFLSLLKLIRHTNSRPDQR